MKQFMLMMCLVVMLSICMGATGCYDGGEDTSDDEVAKMAEKMQQEANAQVPLPTIIHWQEKKMLKQIYELRDQENYICYAYHWNPFKGRYVYIGKCIGYGLPASVQFSSPERKVKIDGGQYDVDGYAPQAEPNGLFMPEGLSATWLMMIDPNTGDPRPSYFEPLITVLPFKLPKGLAEYPDDVK